MADPEAYELVTSQWAEKATLARRSRRLWTGTSMLFAVLSLLALVASIKAAGRGTTYLVTALGVAAAFAWGFLVALFQAVFVIGNPPVRLRLTDVGVELVYGDQRVRFARDWRDPTFLLLIRDFRGWPTPVGSDTVLDTGDRDVIRSLFLSTAPPSAYLTPDAYAALLEAVRSRGFDVTTRTEVGWKASPGWMWPNTAISVRRRPA